MHERAAESIEFIRETMVRSASFTAVPGQGGVAMGAIGVVAAVHGVAGNDRRSAGWPPG